MKKGRIILISVVAVIIVIVLTIEGKMYMDNKESNEIKKEVALYIVQNYEGVKKIQFGELSENKMTGSWTLSAKLNKNNIITFTFQDTSNIKKNMISVYYDPDSFKLRNKVNKHNGIDNIDIQFEGGFK
ncbi:hypothetical protein HB768_02340 [Listeria welshimeri]|nr:hypothetical protein [Listeria welshimeri]MBC1645966.1 hypothetical protein [Listeria welshimeri]MBC2052499.1 hypothetical protein [Listeria welshimeri]MBC2339824.1 hypothetical protein [Listeria welshimeri]MBC6126687.1 hypothetical protein [Listeria welshimeri]